MDMNIEASHVVEVSTAPSSSPKKLTVPLVGLERFPTQQEIEGQDARNRRPVRPIDRQRMRPWLMELLDTGNVFGLRWTNRHQGIFQISWRHASRLGWNLETDGDVFERWARHTGIYKEGDPPEPKRWKANFRCALHSLSDVLELTNAVERRGRNACRTYQFLQNTTITVPKSKAKKQPPKPPEIKVHRNILPLITYERSAPEPETIDLVESASSDELLSETESEGSQKDKVIVQRLEAKSQDAGEDFLLHHDHDYSAGPLRTQKTLYLRQGVGSIVVQREVHGAPEEGEEVKSYLLSNLDQLASAAVGSETIIAQKSPVAGLADSPGSLENVSKMSPTKAVLDLTFDDSKDNKAEYNFKNLLPRLRARLRESEKALGVARKRKGSNIETDFDENEALEHKTKKKEKTEKDDHSQSPPSPPMTRNRSASPKKAVKVVAKSKRTRKESDESASDSTEPLMSSCLLLLEAATRLDNAEKNGGTNTRSSKHKKVAAQSSDSTAEGRRRSSGRSLRSDKHVEVVQEEVVETNDETIIQEGIEIVIHDGETTEVSHELVIEEEVYPENTVQVIYEDEQERPLVTQADMQEDSVDACQYHDILRTTLENIGGELEIATDETSEANIIPKELAIMRRKRDSDKASPQNVVEISGQSETSFPKGLFSGSEIITDNQQQLSVVRKRMKGKGKVSAKDNIYYLDILSNSGSICVKQCDGTETDEKEAASPQSTNSLIKNAIGIQQTVIKRELPVLNSPVPEKQPPQSVMSTGFLQAHSSSGDCPQIFIAAAQNTADQQIIVPVNSSDPAPVEPTHVKTESNSVQQLAGHLNQSGSFITVGPNGKALLYKSDAVGKAPQRTTIIPLINPVASSSPAATNVKISTLPIISTAKASVTVSASPGSAKASDQTALTNSVVPIKLVPKVTVSTTAGPQLATISSQGRTWIIQPRMPTSESQVSKAATIQVMPSSVIGSSQPIITTISGLSDSSKSVLPVSSVNLTTSVPSETSQSVGSLLSSVTTDDTIKTVNLELPTQIIVDPILQLPVAQLGVSQTHVQPTLSISDGNNCSTIVSEQIVATSPTSSVSLNASHISPSVPVKAEIDVTDTVASIDDVNTSSPSFTHVPIKTEIGVVETIVSSVDTLGAEQKTTTHESEPDSVVISQISSNSLMSDTFQDSIPIIKEEMELENSLTKSGNNENIVGLEIQSSADFISPQVATITSEMSMDKGASYRVVENMTDPSSAVAIDVIVKTDDNVQQIFNSTQQGEPHGHVIQVCQTVSNEDVMVVDELSKVNSLSSETVTCIVESKPNITTGEMYLNISSKEEIVSQHDDHHQDSMSIDPSAPLAIGEIPLFAVSKGDSDYMGSD